MGNIAYCETCDAQVELRRQNFQHKYHELLCIMIITGIGLIVYLILKYKKKPNTCPNCERAFDLDNLPPLPQNIEVKETSLN